MKAAWKTVLSVTALSAADTLAADLMEEQVSMLQVGKIAQGCVEVTVGQVAPATGLFTTHNGQIFDVDIGDEAIEEGTFCQHRNQLLQRSHGATGQHLDKSVAGKKKKTCNRRVQQCRTDIFQFMRFNNANRDPVTQPNPEFPYSVKQFCKEARLTSRSQKQKRDWKAYKQTDAYKDKMAAWKAFKKTEEFTSTTEFDREFYIDEEVDERPYFADWKPDWSLSGADWRCYTLDIMQKACSNKCAPECGADLRACKDAIDAEVEASGDSFRKVCNAANPGLETTGDGNGNPVFTDGKVKQNCGDQFNPVRHESCACNEPEESEPDAEVEGSEPEPDAEAED